jgi:hypothetical protein
MMIEVFKKNGIRQLVIGRFGVGVGPLTGYTVPWYHLDKYAWLAINSRVIQLRVLWFYVGWRRIEREEIA